MSAIEKIKNGFRILRNDGISGIRRSLRYHADLSHETREYQRWTEEYDALSTIEIGRIRSRVSALRRKPLFSVIMPVYNTPERWIRLAIESVRYQIYENWELCIADDRSTDLHVGKIIEEYAKKDARIRVVYRAHNGHISAASNSALELALGEFVVLFDHDDELAPHALAELACEIDAYPDTRMLYTDEDIISESGKRYMPKFKPDWSPELFYSMNLVTHLVSYRTDVIRGLGGFRLGFEGSQDYDLALRVVEKIEPASIRHIPRVLYHWRAVTGSAASGLNAKPYAYDRARRAINEHFERTAINAISVEAPLQINRTAYSLPVPAPTVSFVVCGKAESAITLLPLIENSDYPGTIELILTSMGNKPGETIRENVRILYSSDSALYGLLNTGVAAAAGDVICFLDPSTLEVNHSWLEELVGRAVQEQIGAVGAKILYPDRTIKHAGFILGIDDGIGRAHYRFRSDEFGNYMRLMVDQNFSAISSDGMVIRKRLFDELGGFDAVNYPNHFADVDLCLRLQQRARRVAWTPWAEIMQNDEEPSESAAELDRLRGHWPEQFQRDPFYNPNLTVAKDDFSLAFPPRVVR